MGRAGFIRKRHFETAVAVISLMALDVSEDTARRRQRMSAALLEAENRRLEIKLQEIEGIGLSTADGEAACERLQERLLALANNTSLRRAAREAKIADVITLEEQRDQEERTAWERQRTKRQEEIELQNRKKIEDEERRQKHEEEEKQRMLQEQLLRDEEERLRQEEKEKRRQKEEQEGRERAETEMMRKEEEAHQMIVRAQRKKTTR